MRRGFEFRVQHYYENGPYTDPNLESCPADMLRSGLVACTRRASKGMRGSGFEHPSQGLPSESEGLGLGDSS